MTEEKLQGTVPIPSGLKRKLTLFSAYYLDAVKDWGNIPYDLAKDILRVTGCKATIGNDFSDFRH
jgi:hypothetical protein